MKKLSIIAIAASMAAGVFTTVSTPAMARNIADSTGVQVLHGVRTRVDDLRDTTTTGFAGVQTQINTTNNNTAAANDVARDALNRANAAAAVAAGAQDGVNGLNPVVGNLRDQVTQIQNQQDKYVVNVGNYPVGGNDCWQTFFIYNDGSSSPAGEAFCNGLN